MARRTSLDQISRQPNGSYVGIWGRYLLRTAYQRIYSFGSGRMEVAACEGLIRPFEDGTPIPPAAFFGSIKTADRFGVETLTRTLHVLNARQYVDAGASLFLNFDPSVFIDRTISDAALRDLKLVLHESGIEVSRIVCEVTENKSGSDDTLFDFVQALKANGLEIAIDDYGADDSDYHRVRALQPQIVKFDGAWIVRLMESHPGIALLKTMVGTFRDMGIKTVFEGLEEVRQLDIAYECGVDLVQGFILSRPELVPIDIAEAAPEIIVASGPETLVAATQTKPSRPFGRRGVLPGDT